MRMRSRLTVGLAGGLTAVVVSGCSSTHLSFLDPQGPIASAQRAHFWIIVALVMVVVAPVLLLTPVLIWRYRYGSNAAYRPRWAFSWLFDLFIWGVPVLIVGVLSYFLWTQTLALDPYAPLEPTDGQPALRVQVIGFDWKWLFVYPDQHIATVGTLVIPANRSVAFDLTSATVLQSFFIPALGSQIDVMNRMVTRLHLKADSPGEYVGRNMQYNGEHFVREHFIARAVSDDDFAQFVERVQAQGAPLNARRFAMIERRGSADDLKALLNADITPAGSAITFSDVPDGLFSSVASHRQIDWAAVDDRPASIAGPDREFAGYRATMENGS